MTFREYGNCTVYLWHPLVAGVARYQDSSARVVRVGETVGVYYRHGRQRVFRAVGHDVTTFVVEGTGPDIGVLHSKAQPSDCLDTLNKALAEAGIAVMEQVRCNDTLGVTANAQPQR